jgi:hypothetical protein
MLMKKSASHAQIGSPHLRPVLRRPFHVAERSHLIIRAGMVKDDNDRNITENAVGGAFSDQATTQMECHPLVNDHKSSLSI